MPHLPAFIHDVTGTDCHTQSSVQFSSIQLNPVHWLIRSSGEHEGWFSRDPLPVFSAGGPCEQFWHGQGRPLFDDVHPALPLLTTLHTNGTQNAALEAVLMTFKCQIWTNWSINWLKLSEVNFYPARQLEHKLTEKLLWVYFSFHFFWQGLLCFFTSGPLQKEPLTSCPYLVHQPQNTADTLAQWRRGRNFHPRTQWGLRRSHPGTLKSATQRAGKSFNLSRPEASKTVSQQWHSIEIA